MQARQIQAEICFDLHYAIPVVLPQVTRIVKKMHGKISSLDVVCVTNDVRWRRWNGTLTEDIESIYSFIPPGAHGCCQFFTPVSTILKMHIFHTQKLGMMFFSTAPRSGNCGLSGYFITSIISCTLKAVFLAVLITCIAVYEFAWPWYSCKLLISQTQSFGIEKVTVQSTPEDTWLMVFRLQSLRHENWYQILLLI